MNPFAAGRRTDISGLTFSVHQASAALLCGSEEMLHAHKENLSAPAVCSHMQTEVSCKAFGHSLGHGIRSSIARRDVWRDAPSLHDWTEVPRDICERGRVQDLEVDAAGIHIF